MASQAYTHKTLKIKCHIKSEQMVKNEVTVKNTVNNDLNKLLSNILRKFKFLSIMDDSEWSICINSQIIDKSNSYQFSSILSALPPPAVIDIVRTTFNATEHVSYIVTVYLNDRRFDYKLTQDQEDWNDDTYQSLQSAISKQFNLYSSSFVLYGDGDVDIDDIEDIKDQFDVDDNENQSIDIFVKIERNDDAPIEPKVLYHKNIERVQHDPNPNPQHIPPQYKQAQSAKKMSISEWLQVNHLSDIQFIANVTTLDGLITLDAQTLWATLGVMGLNSQQINRLIKALEKEKQIKPNTRPQMKQKGQYNQQRQPQNINPYHAQPAVQPNKGISQWIQSNQLSDAQSIIKALKKEKRKSAQKHYKVPKWEEFKIDDISDDALEHAFEWESDVSIDDTKDDGKHPVWPLIIPNNCSYNANTGIMTRDTTKPRTKLIPYEPALEFIRNISSKIATISIVGKARTGKSLVAGELYAPQKIPCPFDLGHKMDACTYGIWVSAKPVKHPYYKDTVVLIFDVEGTGYHEANKHNDMQLMVVTLLISSYFIYNTKGTFDAPALDEIKFILELTKNIHTNPNDTKNDGTDFKKFFPIFMWLLRDVHLEPMVGNKRVSVRQYFTQKVLSSESGFSSDVMRRQFIRQAFMQMFQKYDAFSLPMPHGNKKVLQKLGLIARSKLQPAFNEHLDAFCEKVLKDTKCKVLFSKDADGEDQYTHCNGTHLSGWIEQCLEWINSDKIPEISSMTDAVMADVFRVSKKKAIKQYKKMLDKGLAHLRDDEKQPLDENEIIQLHLTIYNKVLNGEGKSLQPTKIIQNEYKNDDSDDEEDAKYQDYANDKPQIKVFREFCDEIGHHQNVTKIGQSGIMNRKLMANRTLSTVFCKGYLDDYFAVNIEPMLDEPKKYEAKDFLHKFTELENKFGKDCKGPSKDICWKEFKSKTMHESIQNFKRTKGISDQLLKAERDASKQREEMNRMKEVNEKFRKELELQKKSTKEELARIKKAKEVEAAEYDKKLKESEQRAKDMKESQFVKLAENFQKTNEELKKQLAEIQEKNKKEMEEMVKKFNEKIEETANKQTVIHSGTGPYPYGYYGGYYGGYNGMLPYSLIFSKPYTHSSYPGIINTFEHLISDDATKCAAAYSGNNSFIEANLGGIRFVTHIEVKGTAVSGWCSGNRNSYPCVVQYRNTSNQWITLRDFNSTKMPNNIIITISISQHTAAVRILSSSYAFCGTLRVYGSGGSPYYPHQPRLVLYDDVMGASSILQTFENEFLFTILPHDLQYRKYKLLLRGSVHGFAASTFHSQCNNQGATITVVHSTNNHVFGGYTSLSWTSAGQYTNDTKSFLFLLRSQSGAAVPQKWNVSDTTYSTYGGGGYGPTFGGGHDFYMVNNCNTGNSSCNPYSYKSGGSVTNTTLAGSSSFKVKDYEVWRVL